MGLNDAIQVRHLVQIHQEGVPAGLQTQWHTPRVLLLAVKLGLPACLTTYCSADSGNISCLRRCLQALLARGS